MIDISKSEVDLMEQEDLREQVIDRVEVLDKVKALFLIPDMETMTTKMVADYYEVDTPVIQRCYQRNKEEIDEDGVFRKTIVEMKDFWSEHDVHIKNVVGGAEVIYNNVTMRLPNAGVRLFPKRAILRIGMLLRDSEIAKEVRTQLLNTFEHSTDEQRTKEIDEEAAIFVEIGRAYSVGTKEDVMIANRRYIDYKNRHIDKLENEKVKLSNINKDLKTANEALSGETMTWDDRAILNALVRNLAIYKYHRNFANAWDALYRAIHYKLGIKVKSRKGDGKLIDRIKPEEMKDVVKVAVSMCEEANLDAGKIINKVNASKIRLQIINITHN